MAAQSWCETPPPRRDWSWSSSSRMIGSSVRPSTPTTSAAEYVQILSQDFGNIVIRETNLVDVFIELTGRKVVGG